MEPVGGLLGIPQTSAGHAAEVVVLLAMEGLVTWYFFEGPSPGYVYCLVLEKSLKCSQLRDLRGLSVCGVILPYTTATCFFRYVHIESLRCCHLGSVCISGEGVIVWPILSFGQCPTIDKLQSCKRMLGIHLALVIGNTIAGSVSHHNSFPECVARVPVSLWGSGG